MYLIFLGIHINDIFMQFISEQLHSSQKAMLR